SSRRRHTRWPRDWSSDVCSSDLFDPHSHGPLQPSVKGPHLLLSLVTQRPLQHLSRRLVPHDNLLIDRMKITAYNLHRSAPSSRALVAHHAKSTRVQGADLVMKSYGAGRFFLMLSLLRKHRPAQREISLQLSYG